MTCFPIFCNVTPSHDTFGNYIVSINDIINVFVVMICNPVSSIKTLKKHYLAIFISFLSILGFKGSLKSTDLQILE